MADEDKAVLAWRVLSYLKRSAVEGFRPSDAETRAATAAMTLLSSAFPAEATDPSKMFNKLTQLARTSSQPDLDQRQFQIFMHRRSKVFEMLSNILKQQSDTSKSIISNLR